MSVGTWVRVGEGLGRARLCVSDMRSVTQSGPKTVEIDWRSQSARTTLSLPNEASARHTLALIDEALGFGGAS